MAMGCGRARVRVPRARRMCILLDVADRLSGVCSARGGAGSGGWIVRPLALPAHVLTFVSYAHRLRACDHSRDEILEIVTRGHTRPI